MTSSTSSPPTEPEAASPSKDASKESKDSKEEKKKSKVRSVSLPVESHVSCLTQEQLNHYIEMENEMIMQVWRSYEESKGEIGEIGKEG